MVSGVGENLTLTGIDWSLVTPGAQLEVGPVLLELTSYVVPCRHIRGSFTNEEFLRVSQRVRPGWSRLYSRVLEEGFVTPGLKAFVICDL